MVPGENRTSSGESDSAKLAERCELDDGPTPSGMAIVAARSAALVPIAEPQDPQKRLVRGTSTEQVGQLAIAIRPSGAFRWKL